MSKKASNWGTLYFFIGLVSSGLGVLGMVLGTAMISFIFESVGISDPTLEAPLKLLVIFGFVSFVLFGLVFIFMGQVLDWLKTIAVNTQQSEE